MPELKYMYMYKCITIYKKMINTGRFRLNIFYCRLFNKLDWTQIRSIYKGPLHIINNNNNAYVSNSRIQYTLKILVTYEK